VRPVTKWAGLLLLAVVGCAPAPRQPRPIEELAEPRGARSQEEVTGLLARAEVLFSQRDLEAVREAAAIFLDAAAADTARTEGLVGAARAEVWLAEHDPDPAPRKRATTEAVHAAQWCEQIAPRSAVCAHWLGAALGVQAREQPLTGIAALPRIKEAFERAAGGEPTLEEAGPDRALALFYLRAPGWPGGPGDSELGLEHARKAVALRPEYPPTSSSWPRPSGRMAIRSERWSPLKQRWGWPELATHPGIRTRGSGSVRRSSSGESCRRTNPNQFVWADEL
jgi:hypothetical protein